MMEFLVTFPNFCSLAARCALACAARDISLSAIFHLSIDGAFFQALILLRETTTAMDFTNYKVHVMLKNGSKSTGFIQTVDCSQIILGGDRLGNGATRVANSDIADIKVIQLPKKKAQEARQDRAERHDSRNSTPRPQPTASSTRVEPDMSLEFDFAANLAMFDKKLVFADFQKNDTVDPSQRLVGHNKKKQLQTQDKYEPTEMVLDTLKRDNWDCIGTPNALQLSPYPPVASRQPLMSADALNYRMVRSTLKSPVACALPVQLVEIERLATEKFGVTQALMAETAAINLSQLILSRFLGGLTRLSNAKNHNLPPLVLLLVGLARIGGRAYATGRHLANHGVRVLAFVTNPDDDDPDLALQARMLESSGGKVVRSDWEQLLHITNTQLDTPVELIIDGLQGYDCRLDDVFYEPNQAATLKGIIAWCNVPAHAARVLSLDLPLGIDGGSDILAGALEAIHARWCVLMGVPISGLLLAYKLGTIDEELQHFLVDIGVPNSVYAVKNNLRKFDRFWYCLESALALEVVKE